MSFIHCNLPEAGLGNQLFPLMKAFVFGHLNNWPVTVTGYHQLKFGPYFRGEKSKRKYTKYFTFQKNIFQEQIEKWTIISKGLQIHHEPPLKKIDDLQHNKRIYKYTEIPHWSDYFKELKNYRQLVIERLWGLLNEDIKEQVNKQTTPFIGVHIRMGDFRKLRSGEDFGKVGAVRTPELYFIEVIQSIRDIYGSSLPVSVFTDGYRKELKNLLEMDNIRMVEGNPDIVDLLLLSKSKVIVTSATSTFSYWAGFLSDAPLILHPDYINGSIRLPEKGKMLYEGPVTGLSKSLLVPIKTNEAID